MGVTSVEKLAGLLLGDAANAEVGKLFLSELENADPAWNPEVTSVIPAGHTHPNFIALNARREEIPFSTMQVASCLARMVPGALYSTNASATKLFYRTIANLSGAGLAASSLHTVFTAAKALAYGMSITAGHRKPAMFRGRVVPVYDGTNQPLVRVGTAAITEDPLANEVFELGPIIAATATRIEGCDNLEVNLNPNVFELHDESEKKTTYAAVHEIAPVLSFTATDRTVGTLEGPVADFRFHLVRMKNFDECYLPAEEQHIIGTVKQGLLVKSARQDSPTGTRMELHCGGDETNGWVDAPIEWLINVAFDLT